MPKTRVILELGSGNDLHGSDYTKAALRAVQDALYHSSLSFVRSLKIDKQKIDVEVTIGVQRPESAEAQPGDPEVEARIGELQCDDQADQHPDDAPEDGGEEEFPDDRIVVGELLQHRARGSGAAGCNCARTSHIRNLEYSGDGRP